MSLKHTFTSGLPDSGDASKVDGPKWDAEHLVDSANVGAVPAGKLRLAAQDFAGRSVLNTVGAAGVMSPMQTAFIRSRPAYWLPYGNNSTLVSTVGIGMNAGNPTARIVGSVSYFTSQRRIGYVTPATPNANVNARAGTAADRIWIIGTVPRTGGFLQVWRMGTSQYANDMRCFFGMFSSGSAYGSASPSSLIEMMGIGFDAGDTVWSVYNNDSTGAPTKFPLGAGFPCNTNNVDVIEFAMRVAPGAQTASWVATNLTTGATASGSMLNDLPIELPMQPHLNVTNGPSGNAAGVDLMLMYLESEN